MTAAEQLQQEILAERIKASDHRREAGEAEARAEKLLVQLLRLEAGLPPQDEGVADHQVAPDLHYGGKVGVAVCGRLGPTTADPTQATCPFCIRPPETEVRRG